MGPRLLSLPDCCRLRPASFLAVAVAALVPGCQTIEEIAPPVPLLGAAHGSAPSTLESGRHLYLTKCTKCHSAEPVRDYSELEWKEIMPEMAHESKLTAEEEAAVLAYVLAARQVAPPG